VEAHSLLDSSQFGFRRNKSCELQLLSYTYYLAKSIDSKIPVHAIYLDLQKAFDKVPHAELLYKVQFHFGVEGRVLRWLEAFLASRMQRVNVGSAFSNWRSVSSGVPQGSVLAPLLFLLYVHDMQAGLCGVELLKFADDTKLFCAVRDNHESEKLQESLDLLDAWCKKWKMPVNVKKSAVVKFGRDGAPQLTYSLNGENLKLSHKERDLGVVMSSSLSYKPHIQAITTKALQLYGWMARTLISRQRVTVLKVYKCLIRPTLEYACVVWSPSRVGLISRLENVQRKITKLVVRGSVSYEDRLKILNLPSLRWRRDYLDLLMVHRILHGDEHLRKQLFTYSSEVSGSNLRRHRLTLYKRAVHSDAYRHHFSNRVVDSWNSLPAQLLSINGFDLFKRSLKIYLLSKRNPYK
jgi:ribonucleases P/MRP protein subunit RPP40